MVLKYNGENDNEKQWKLRWQQVGQIRMRMEGRERGKKVKP